MVFLVKIILKWKSSKETLPRSWPLQDDKQFCLSVSLMGGPTESLFCSTKIERLIIEYQNINLRITLA